MTLYRVLTVKPNIARLAKQLKRHRITQDQVAAAAKRPVHRTMVCKVLKGVVVSANVVESAERLILASKLRELERAS